MDFKAIKYVCEIDGNKSVSEIDELAKILDDFFNLKLEIKKALIEFNYIEITDELARKVLQKINTNQPFEADKLLSILTQDKNYETNDFQLDELISESELNELEINLFYSWFSGTDYVRNLYSIGSLILGIFIPDNFKNICDETRRCLALCQYQAVYSLCRTMLESCLIDVGTRKGIVKLTGDNYHDYHENKPHKLINTLLHPDSDAHNLYNDISSFIHGFKTVDYKTAENTYFESVRVSAAGTNV